MVAKVTKTSGRTRAAAIAMAAAAAGSGVMLAGGTASAATLVSGTTSLTNRADSGGNGNWAVDTLQRTLTVSSADDSVCEGDSATSAFVSGNDTCYTAEVTDSGTFVTDAGAYTPNQGADKGDTFKEAVSGKAAGSTGYTFFLPTADGQPDGTIASSLSGNPTGTGETTGDWYKQALSATQQADAVGGENNDWTWTYTAGNGSQSWTDAFSDGDGQNATAGDITGPAITLGTEATQYATEGTAFSAADTATTDGSAALTYSASGLPSGLGIDSSTGTISGTPTGTGQYSVTVHVRDAEGYSSNYQSFVLDVKSATSKLQVPNVVGLTASAAADAVRNDGFTYKGQGFAGSDIVTAQTPAAGTYAAAGTNVAFTVKAPAAEVELSGGNVSDVTSSGFKVGWKETGAPAGEKYGLTLHFPGSENGRTASVSVLQGVYSGLPHGDAGTVTIQPELNGVDNGAAGTVYVHTAS